MLLVVPPLSPFSVIVLLLLPSTCTVCTVSVSLVTLTTYPSASDESSVVQLTVIVVAVLLTSVREEGAVTGTNNYWYQELLHLLPLPFIVKVRILISLLSG